MVFALSETLLIVRIFMFFAFYVIAMNVSFLLALRFMLFHFVSGILLCFFYMRVLIYSLLLFGISPVFGRGFSFLIGF